jgi:hypothetical protein
MSAQEPELMNEIQQIGHMGVWTTQYLCLKVHGKLSDKKNRECLALE